MQRVGRFGERAAWQRGMRAGADVFRVLPACGSDPMGWGPVTRRRGFSASVPSGRLAAWFAPALLVLVLSRGVVAQTASDIVNTRHNLSVSGPGAIRALTETRICVFCHTPHNATPLSPLWNKEIEPQVYTLYTSPTLRAPLSQPFGPTKLCLSCHDGTIALGAVVNPAEGIPMSGGAFPPGSLSDFGLDLSGHHPVSFSYRDALPNDELVSDPPADLTYGGEDQLHCITCHDAHNDAYGKFLVKDNVESALCVECHQMRGWVGSAHATSSAPVGDNLPRPPKTWPNYLTLREWGCEVCHTPHFAPTKEKLLNFTDGPPAFSCTADGCHGSNPPPAHGLTASAGRSRLQRVEAAQATGVDIGRQLGKVSAHRESVAAGSALRGGANRGTAEIRGVSCSECHNPHAVNDRAAEAPEVSGRLQELSGIDRNGVEVHPARYEYEICFKCHADNNPDLDYVPRVVSVTNTRVAFDPSNPSYHPVIDSGRNTNIPSLPSPFEPDMLPSSFIYCTSCHADDEGVSRGPHGSAFAPILRDRYETADFTPESYENYALCYRCHDRSSILSDASFQKKRMATTATGGGHSGHLAAGASCAACHDPHGVTDTRSGGLPDTGSHTHLINFDTRIVFPNAGSAGNEPYFTDNGIFAGSCTLECHGVAHDSTTASYP